MLRQRKTKEAVIAEEVGGLTRKEVAAAKRSAEMKAEWEALPEEEKAARRQRMLEVRARLPGQKVDS